MRLRPLLFMLILLLLAGCVRQVDNWPGRSDGRHTYMNAFRPLDWRAPAPEMVDSIAQYDFVFLSDIESGAWRDLAPRLRARPNPPLLLHCVPFQRVWDYGNGNVPRHTGLPRWGQAVHDAMWPDHIARVAPSGEYAVATWGGSAEWVINWYDPKVPELMADLVVELVNSPHATYRPDGIWLDWWEYPGSGWWILNGDGQTVDGDGDGLVGSADPQEQQQTYVNWLKFCYLLRLKLGNDYFVMANGGAPFDPSARAGSVPLFNGLNGAFHEHFPWGWGSTAEDYCRFAFERDGRKWMGNDSFLEYPIRPNPYLSNRNTKSGGYVLLDNNLQPNFPYVAIMSLFADGTVACAGPFASLADEASNRFTWAADPMERLKELGGAKSPAIRTGSDTWTRHFDHGYVVIRWNQRAELPIARNWSHAPNPGGPFQYLVVKYGVATPDTLYQGGGWPRQQPR